MDDRSYVVKLKKERITVQIFAHTKTGRKRSYTISIHVVMDSNLKIYTFIIQCTLGQMHTMYGTYNARLINTPSFYRNRIQFIFKFLHWLNNSSLTCKILAAEYLESVLS